jgi:hypothetical protein
MNTIRLLLLLSIGFSLRLSAQPSEPNFDWLTGNWIRTNEQAGMRTIENWVKVHATEYHGFSCTVKETDTVWQEKVVLRLSEKQWQYAVTGMDAPSPTIFGLIKIEEAGFVAHQPENDFPKYITYSRDKNILRAWISDEKKKIPFEFKRVEN